MIDQESFDALLPRACAWAKSQEDLILRLGSPLSGRQVADAEQVGVQQAARVRVLVVDRIPLPDDEQLAEAATRAQIIPSAARGMAIGHGVMIRADCWNDRELLVHQLVHVAQCERSGSLDVFVQEYLADRRSATFSAGSLEDEARRVAREICAQA